MAACAFTSGHRLKYTYGTFLHITGLLDAHISMAFSRCIAGGRIYKASKTGSCYPYAVTSELFLFHLHVYCPVNVVNTCLQVSAAVMAGQ